MTTMVQPEAGNGNNDAAFAIVRMLGGRLKLQRLAKARLAMERRYAHDYGGSKDTTLLHDAWGGEDAKRVPANEAFTRLLREEDAHEVREPSTMLWLVLDAMLLAGVAKDVVTNENVAAYRDAVNAAADSAYALQTATPEEATRIRAAHDDVQRLGELLYNAVFRHVWLAG